MMQHPQTHQPESIQNQKQATNTMHLSNQGIKAYNHYPTARTTCHREILPMRRQVIHSITGW
jgi:hypothetical protein